jgi:3-oxoacyl-[acyl-carrier-protein] synthase II
MLGSGIGGLGTLEDNHTALLQKSPSRVSPFTIPMMISNIASGVFSIEYGFGGPNMAIVTACATANHSIGEAWRMIKFGDADAFVAGGSEASIRPMGLAGFMNMKALSTRNEDPTAASVTDQGDLRATRSRAERASRPRQFLSYNHHNHLNVAMLTCFQ